MKKELIINSEQALEQAIQKIRQDYKIKKFLNISVSTSKTRTDQQRKALEVWCRQLAETLNNKQLYPKVFFNKGFDLEWTQEMVKNNIWRTVQKEMIKKESTTDLTTGEIIEVFEYINMKLAERGIHEPWPERKK